MRQELSSCCNWKTTGEERAEQYTDGSKGGVLKENLLGNIINIFFWNENWVSQNVVFNSNT